MSEVTIEDVVDAADRLVAAFAATDTDAYFECFAESATFVFYPEAHRFDDRATYQRVWQLWLDDGWRVESCSSTERLIQLLGDAAVLTHSVATVTSVAGEQTETFERETIVFAREAGRLVAVHEHLSPVPTPEVESP